ncbi:MAG: hypothetical protein V7646_7527 [Pseudonocardia sp.]|jgi:hypothetical protein
MPRPDGGGPRRPTAVRAYANLLAITIVNPLTVIYFAALVLGSRCRCLIPGHPGHSRRSALTDPMLSAVGPPREVAVGVITDAV